MFTQNQIRQFLPVSGYQSSTMAGGSTNIGKVKVTATPEGEYNVQYVDSTGKVISFLIPAKNILWKKATPAAKMAYTSRASLVTLNSDYLIDHDSDADTPATLISGQDYILNVRINGLYWDSDEVWGHKYGVVHATSGMTPSKFYVKMALSLAKNLSRDAAPMLKVYVTTSTTVAFSGTSTVTEVTADTAESSLTGTYVGVVIDEVEQPWRLGVMPQHPVEFIANPSTILFSGEEVVWGTSEKIAGGLTLGNGKKVADMEYFYHANRGDYNREAAWPNNWPSVEQIDPAKTYDIIDIHWSWIGNNHAIQRSEKDLTLAFDSTSHTAADAFLAAWNGLSGVDVDFSASSLSNTVLN